MVLAPLWLKQLLGKGWVSLGVVDICLGWKSDRGAQTDSKEYQVTRAKWWQTVSLPCFFQGPKFRPHYFTILKVTPEWQAEGKQPQFLSLISSPRNRENNEPSQGVCVIRVAGSKGVLGQTSSLTSPKPSFLPFGRRG